VAPKQKNTENFDFTQTDYSSNVLTEESILMPRERLKYFDNFLTLFVSFFDSSKAQSHK
jgi:hypothetical protein